MARGHVELDIALTSEDRLSAVITRVNEKMYGFSKATDDANNDANDNFAKITGYIKGVSTTFTELNSKVALVQAAFGALQRAGEFAISGEIANNAEEVFSQITGGAENAAQVMDELRAVTKNTIDDTRIQQFASSLRIAGVEFAEIARILQLSTQVSQVTGEDLFELSKRMQDAAISGAQTEFEKLGVVVNVNEELKKRAEAENTLLEEMTKSEQVTARLNILQDTLAVNLRAAGVDTSRLSTELQGLRTSMENTTSSAQQNLANLITGETFERMVDEIENVIHAIERMTGQTIYNSARSKKAQEMLAEGAQISAEQAAEALEMLSKRSGTFVAAQGGYANAFAKKIIEIKNKNIEKSREEAMESLKAQAVEKEATKQRIEFLIKENQSLQIALASMKSEEQAQEILRSKFMIKTNELMIEKLKGMSLDLFNFRSTLAEETFKVELKDAQEKDDEKEKAEKRRRYEAAKQRRKEREQQIKENSRRDLQASIESARTLRSIQLSQLDDETKIRERHNLEILDLEKRQTEELLLNEDKRELEKQAIRDRFQLEELELSKKQSEQLAKIQEQQDRLDAESERKKYEERKQLRRENLEAFQAEMLEYAEALEHVIDPLEQLANHQQGASSEMKALGGATAGTSAALNVYANETDASKSATDRLKQGIPGMVSASGAAASAFVKDAKRKALIQGSFEAASALGALATGNFIGAAGHTAAAAAFFALAGKSGAGAKGQGATARRQGALTTGGTPGTGATATTGGGAVVVNVQGFALGSAQEMGARMAQMMDNARETGLDTAEV